MKEEADEGEGKYEGQECGRNGRGNEEGERRRKGAGE